MPSSVSIWQCNSTWSVGSSSIIGHTGQQRPGRKIQSCSGHASGLHLSLIHNDLPSIQALCGGRGEGGDCILDEQ